MKNGDIFSYALGILYANFQQFPIKCRFGRNSQTKISTFNVVKNGNFCLGVSPEGLFYWKLLKIGIQSDKDIKKLFFKFEGLPLPTLPVFRVVLLHTEASGERLFRGSVCQCSSKFRPNISIRSMATCLRRLCIKNTKKVILFKAFYF